MAPANTLWPNQLAFVQTLQLSMYTSLRFLAPRIWSHYRWLYGHYRSTRPGSLVYFGRPWYPDLKHLTDRYPTSEISNYMQAQYFLDYHLAPFDSLRSYVYCSPRISFILLFVSFARLLFRHSRWGHALSYTRQHWFRYPMSFAMSDFHELAFALFWFSIFQKQNLVL